MILLLAGVSSATEPDPPLRLATLAAGAASSTVDLWRGHPGADKIHVRVALPDGSPALFMIDTGSPLSVVHPAIAARLGLSVRTLPTLVEGLAGTTAWNHALLPRLGIGDFELVDVDVAVGVPGVPESAGPLPVAGLLGNNVWANFTCVVDYPADILELYRPGALRERARWRRLDTDQLRARVSVAVRTAARTVARVDLKLDTGAPGLNFIAGSGEPFRADSTVGMEPIFGIGAGLDELPYESFLRQTRRIPVASVALGGRRIVDAAWVPWIGGDEPPSQGLGSDGLVGHRTMGSFRTIFDFPGRRFALSPSRRAPRAFDAPRAWLAVEEALADPGRAATRARLRHALGDLEGARTELRAGLAERPQDAEIAGLLAWLARMDGDLEAALAILSRVPPGALAERGEWVGYINGLVIAGRIDEALTRSEDAVAAAHPTDRHQDDFLVARSDALLAAGRTGEADAALIDASAVSPVRSAHLLRRARLAEATGDEAGARQALGRLVELNPLDGRPLWLYALSTRRPEVPALLALLDATRARLHPGDAPLDYLGAALLAAGQPHRAAEALANGRVLECVPMEPGPDRDNCDAWFWALEGRHLDEAEARVASAIALRPWNDAFHDTAAVVAWADGRLDDAVRHARDAARRSPGDPYLSWQLSRLVRAKVPH